MTTCKECRNFFPLVDDDTTGDCVQRVVDPRQAYHKAIPVSADNDSSKCTNYNKK